MIKKIIMYVLWWIFILTYFFVTADKNPLILIMFTLIATIANYVSKKYAQKSRFNDENLSDKLSTNSENKKIKKKKSVLNKFKSREHIVKLILGELLAVSALLLFIDLFEIQCNTPIVLFVAFIINFIIWLEWGRKTTVYAIILFVFGFILIGFVQNSAMYIEGILLLINRIFDTIGKYSGFVFNKYAVSSGDEAYYVYNTYIMSLGALFIGLISYFIVSHKQKFFLYLYNAIVLMALVLFSIELHWVYFVFYMISVISVCWYHKKLCSDKEFFKGLVSILLITFIALLISYPINKAIRTHRSPVDAIVYKLKYNDSEADSYGKGAVAGQKLIRNDIDALELNMSNPTTVYLKGFVGHKFNGNRWCELDHESVYNNRELFHILNNNGFKHYNQIGYVCAINEDLTAETISIKHLNSGNQYVYMPYGTKDFIYTELLVENADSINKEPTINEYSVGFYPSMYLNYSDYSIDVNDETFSDYNFYENYYEEYINSTYLYLSESDRTTLNEVIKRNDAFLEVDECDYETCIALVKSILNNELSYDENVKMSFLDNDCLDTLFNDINKGYDIHYATAATLLFRYYGVPSRYVEGYIVCDEDIKESAPNEPFKISGKNAHAWTEIYVSDIGWVPVEVCNSYYELMFKGKPELVISLTNISTDNVLNEQGMSEKLVLVFCVIIGFLVLVLAVFAVVFIRRMIIIKNRRVLLESDNYVDAVNAYCDCFCKVLRFCKIYENSDSLTESLKIFRESLSEDEIQNFDIMVNVFVSAQNNKKIKKKDYRFVSESVPGYIEQITEKQSVLTNIGLYLIVGV